MKLAFGSVLVILFFCEQCQPQEKGGKATLKKTASEIADDFFHDFEKAKKLYFPGPVIKDFAEGARIHVTGFLDKLTSEEVVAKSETGETKKWKEYKIIFKTPFAYEVILRTKKVSGNLKSKGPQTVDAIGQFQRCDREEVTIYATEVKLIPVKKTK